MKYSRYMRQVESGCTLCEFRGAFLNYKRLKKLLKHAVEEGSDASFFKELEGDLKRVNRVFTDVAERAIECGQLGLGAFLARMMCIRRTSAPGTVVGKGKLPTLTSRRRQQKLLLQLVHWCREYAAVNGIALRKLCKKHDKLCRSATGQHFLQNCWQGPDGSLGAILHSPLLQELAALEHRLVNMLGRPAPPTAQPLPAGGPKAVVVPVSRVDAPLSTSPEDEGACGGCGAGCQAASGQACPAIPHEVDLQCSICLSPLYQPLGLQCGHRFCRPCFLASANLKYHLGPTRAILASASSELPCPQCRQMGRSEAVMRLRCLGKLSKERHPDAWAERKEEEAQWWTSLQRKLELGNLENLPIVDHVEFTCCAGSSGY